MSLIHLHPLAITTICESETKLRHGGTRLSSNAVLIGLLFGTMEEETRMIHLHYAMEAIYQCDPHQQEPVLNLSKIAERKSLWCTVNPSHILMGWYSTDTILQSWHMNLHQQIISSLLFHSDPLFLLMTPDFNANSRILPIKIFHMVTKDDSSMEFQPLKYQLDGLLAEKVALDEVVKSVPSHGRSAGKPSPERTPNHVLHS